MKDKLLRWLNWALVADFFLVLFGFFWLAIAVVGRAAGVPLGLDIWHQLWQPVFTPAIGILMAATIVSGLVGWIVKRLKPQQPLT
jgi:hypothetical protein